MHTAAQSAETLNHGRGGGGTRVPRGRCVRQHALRQRRRPPAWQTRSSVLERCAVQLHRLVGRHGRRPNCNGLHVARPTGRPEGLRAALPSGARWITLTTSAAGYYHSSRGSTGGATSGFRPNCRGPARGKCPAPAPLHRLQASQLTPQTTNAGSIHPNLPGTGHTIMLRCPPDGLATQPRRAARQHRLRPHSGNRTLGTHAAPR